MGKKSKNDPKQPTTYRGKRPKKRPQSRPKKKKLMDVLVFFADADEESVVGSLKRIRLPADVPLSRPQMLARMDKHWLDPLRGSGSIHAQKQNL